MADKDVTMKTVAYNSAVKVGKRRRKREIMVMTKCRFKPGNS